MISNELQHNFKTNIRFKEICIGLLSRYYPWDVLQIEEFKDIINYEEMMFMKNDTILWSLDLIEILKDKMEWGSLWKTNGLELNLDFFLRYEEYIDFSFIHHHKNIDWSNQLLDTYKEKWDWNGLMMHPIVAEVRNIKKYETNYNWDKFSSNRHLKLSDEIIETYLNKWNWAKLSRNVNFKVDKNGIEKYKEHICFNNLSRNPSMVPFILAFPNQYDWNWSAFVQNTGVVFGDKLIEFLVSKFKSKNSHLKHWGQDVKDNYAKSALIKSNLNNIHFNRDFLFSRSFNANCIPWKVVIQRKPEVLKTQEIEEHLDLEKFDKSLSYRIVQRLSKDYIKSHANKLLKYRWSIFRYGQIDQEFFMQNSIIEDWFQLAFNELFDWELDFLINNLNKFESNYGLSQNKRLFELLFGGAKKEDIDSLLRTY